MDGEEVKKKKPVVLEGRGTRRSFLYSLVGKIKAIKYPIVGKVKSTKYSPKW